MSEPETSRQPPPNPLAENVGGASTKFEGADKTIIRSILRELHGGIC